MTARYAIAVLLAIGASAADTRSGAELAAAAADAFGRGRAAEAVALLQRALRLQPGNPTFEAALGQIFLSTGQASQAVPLLEHSLRVSPGDLDVRIALAQAYQNSDRDREALRTLGANTPSEPYRPVWLFLRGFSQFRSGQTEEAAKTFRELLPYPDMRAPARFFLANCHYAANELEAALPEYEQAIREGDIPSNRALNAYYYNYGLTLYRLRRFGEATAAFRKSTERFARDPLPRFFLARSLAEERSYQEAIRLLEELLPEFPDFAPAVYQLARLQAAHGDKVRAQELFRRFSAMKQQETATESALERQLKLGR